MSQIKIEKRNILVIVIAWSLLIYVGYNVLTVEAKEKYDYDSYEEYNEIVEPLCNDKGGKLNHGDGYCYFDERDKELQFEKELDDKGLGADYTAEEEASWNLKAEAEIAAKEDAICDDEDADTTNIKLCMSDKREQQLDNIVKTCDKVDGKLNSKGECETDGSGDTPKADRFNEELMKLEEETGYPSIKEDEPIIEDWGNTVKTEEEQARDKVIKILEESEEGNEVHGGAEIEYTTDEADNESNDEEDEPEEQEEESNDDESEEEDDSNENEEDNSSE